MPAVFVFALGGALFLQDFLSLCKSLNDLVYPCVIMITYWAECVAIKRSRNSVNLTACHTHTHAQSHIKWIYIFLELLYSRLRLV